MVQRFKCPFQRSDNFPYWEGTGIIAISQLLGNKLGYSLGTNVK